MKCKLSARHHLGVHDRGRAVECLQSRQSVTTVTTAIGVTKSIISGLKKDVEGRNALQNHTGSRERTTMPKEHRFVFLVAKRDKSFTPTLIAADLTTISVHVFLPEQFLSD